ncbi:MAG: hypothetical protein IPM02_24625 [Betaproteobacteria bacterium]|nr:hypothetical protein [Betaproteobacteria bacterium]
MPTVRAGAIGPVKGARRLERLVALTRQARLPLRWVLIGYLDRQYLPIQDDDAVFTVHGPTDRRRFLRCSITTACG